MGWVIVGGIVVGWLRAQFGELGGWGGSGRFGGFCG